MKVLCCFAVFVITVVNCNSQTTLDEIIGDMNLPHEGLPHGVPASYDWQAKPRRGAPEPQAGWTAAIAWGQVYEWAGGNEAVNTRIQIKDLAMYYLSKKDNKWHLLQSAIKVSGANYIENFAGDVNKPANIRIETGGSISTTCGDGYNFHFWPGTGRITIPVNDVAGCYVTVKARLIVNDSSLPDDREKAKYLMSVGGDWWESLTAPWDNFKTNMDIGIGRFRFITPEWKSFNMFSVPDDTIRKNPPPYVELSTAVNQFEKLGEKGFMKVSNDNSIINILINIPEKDKIKLSVYDISGKWICEISNQLMHSGNHNFYWNTSALKPGIYLITLEGLKQKMVKKIRILN